MGAEALRTADPALPARDRAVIDVCELLPLLIRPGWFPERCGAGAWPSQEKARMRAETRMVSERSDRWTGWVAFGGMMLLVIGSINIFQGVVAWVANEKVVVVADKFVGVDFTSWGWILVLSGVLMIAVAFGLLLGMTWARIVGIVLVALHAVAQVAWLGAYPVWSLLMITLDTIVLFALTVRWSAASDGLGFADDRDGSSAGMPGDPLHGQLPHETASYQRRVT